jgi:hypothetical protein
MDKVEAFLEQSGVQGMRWGVRQDKGVRGYPPSKSKTKAKTAHLSNEELQKVVNRLRLEQQYSELSRPKATKGKKFATSILEGSGKAAIGAFVGAATTIAVKKVFNKGP